VTLETPFGPAWAELNERGALTAFGFGAPRREFSGPDSAELSQQLKAFFSGAQARFDVALEPRGTEFQKRVWAELVKISAGQRITYAELAIRVERPGAARAAGRANATNPIALLIPCHRVIGSDGSLTGYEYGIELKEQLLRFEAAAFPA
jgi:methylated-DNA-[protein]-cysteine S-methyltransferase